MTPVEIIITSIGGTAALVAILGWLTKSLVTHLLDKDIHEYKIRLNAEKDEEIARLRYSLEKMADEHRIRFEELQARRGAVIAELYSKIVEFYLAVDRFVDFAVLFKGEQLENEKMELWDAVDSFKIYAEKNRIYFSDKICQKLDDLYASADEPASMLMTTLDQNDNEQIMRSWSKAKEALSGDVSEVRSEIEKEFRDLLGVTN